MRKEEISCFIIILYEDVMLATIDLILVCTCAVKVEKYPLLYYEVSILFWTHT